MNLLNGIECEISITAGMEEVGRKIFTEWLCSLQTWSTFMTG